MFDQNLMFSDGQNLALAAGSYLSDKSIPGGAASGSPAIGGALQATDFGHVHGRMQILIFVTTAFTTVAGATLQLQVVQADDDGLTTNLEVLRETRVLPVSFFSRGAFRFGPPPPMTRKSLGLRYVIGTGATTAGVVTAGLAYGVPSHAANLLG